MKVAYLIRAHYAPAQLGRLVDRLDSENAAFFIHISARTSAGTHSKMQQVVGERANVQWVERVATYYPGFSLLQSTLVGLRAIAAAEPTSHTVLLSGQDYPARPTPEIEKFFQEQAGESFVDHFALPAAHKWPGEHGGLDRIRYLYFEHAALQDTDASPPHPAPTIPSRAAAVRRLGLVRAVARRGALHRILCRSET